MAKINKTIHLITPRCKGRKPSGYPLDGGGIPLRITRLFPMKLKDITIDQIKEAKQENDLVCMTELMSLIDCFEKHDFNASLCQQQSKMLENCYSVNAIKKREIKMRKSAEAPERRKAFSKKLHYQ